MEQCSPFALRLGSVLESRLTQLADPGRQAPRQATTAADAKRLLAKPIESSTTLEGGIGELFHRLLEAMAVSGRVQRSELAADADPEIRGEALGHLAASCVVERREDGVWWILARRPRCDVLIDIAREGRLAELLSGPLPATDSFGQSLREILSAGSAVRIEGRTHLELLELIAATELISDAGLPHPDLAAMRVKLQEPSALEEYTTVVPPRFIGRATELQRLGTFLRGTAPSWRGIVVTGLGGAGKSTLVAKFAQDVASRQAATVVILDFDRPGIDPRDTHWLGSEIMRQVGQQYPGVRERLRSVRHLGRPDRGWQAQRVSSDSSEVHLSQRVEASLVAELRPALEAAGTGARPVLLVLDTFEEVIQHGLTDAVQKWLDQLSDALYPTSLKVVYSGRLFDLGLEQVSRRSQVEVIELGELDRGTAAALLSSYGVAADLAVKLVESDVLPLRPLELKLLARVLQDDPDASLERLERELQSGGPAAKESFAALVYRRVLLRIRDPILQKLAYPGLVLRYVTVDIIRQVLAPALDLPVMEDEDARRLLEQLAGCEWLATRGADNRVWHRRDLRRSMLRVMIGSDPERARAVSQAAIGYFEGFDDRASQAEAMYHRLLYVRPDDTDPAVQDLSAIAQASSYIHFDAADLSASGAALLKFAGGAILGLSEIHLLPWGLRVEAYSKTGASLVAARQFSTAAAVSAAMQADESIPQMGDRSNATWQLDTGFARADWAELTAGDWEDVLERLACSALAYPLIIEAGYARDAAAYARELAQLRESLPPRLQSARAVPLWRASMSETAVSRVLMNAVLLNDRTAPSAYRKLADQLLQALGRRPPRSATLVRRLILARAALQGRLAAEIKVSAPTLCLAPDWLASAARITRPLADRKLLDAVAVAVDKVERGPAGQRLARKVLAAADAAASSRTKSRRAKVQSIRLRGLKRGPEAELLLRGPDPEFRDPARFALLDAYPGDDGHRNLGAILRDVLPFHLTDLESGRFAETIASDPEYLLEDYIELVDRTWRLGELLRRAHTNRPSSAKLAAVYRAWEIWDAAVRRALSRAPAKVAAGPTTHTSSVRKAMPTATAFAEATLESMVRLGDIVAPEAAGLERAGHEPTTPPEELEDRDGYDEKFLAGWKIPVPRLTGAAAKDVRKLPGNRGHVLKYTHFSVVLSASRRMPMLTACNIDGEESVGIKRTAVPWAFDGRVPKQYQWGDALYDSNALDRGHMVRREDPVWGKPKEAKQANVDTFHFTNSCPQMAGVNQHIWLGLENYILQHARADGSKVTVFTGPFFSDKDLPYRDALVPLAFWKVVAIVMEDGRPSATAYKVSQEKELADLEFVYAGYKTFQISIQQVIDSTGIDFSDLARHDGFSHHEHATGTRMEERLDSFESIRV